MNEFIGSFLVLCIVLYAATGGADFGAGILELFAKGKMRERQKEVMTHAIAPVWEANHIWLIIAVVILFMGFPLLFRELSVRFHIPLTVMLLGIVIRGCSFAFRHYDAKKDESEKYYAAMFIMGSLMAPFAQGVVTGGLLSLHSLNNGSFYEMFLEPWFSVGPIVLGFFVCALYAWIAAVYLIGESPEKDLRELFRRRTLQSGGVVILLLAAVFVLFENSIKAHPAVIISDALIALGLTGVSLAAVWLPKLHFMVLRVAAGTVSSLAVLTWLFAQYFILNDQSLVLPAPVTTQRQLVLALCAGSLLIVPSLFYLLITFKRPSNQA